MRVMTTLLSPVEVGAVSIALSISVMLNLTLINPIWMYILRNLHEWQRLNLLPKKILIGFAWYLLCVSLLSPLIVSGISWLGWGVPGGGGWVIIAIALHFAIFSAVSTLPLLINNLGQITKAAALNGGIALASLGGCVLTVKFVGSNVTGWMIGLSAGYAVMFLVGIPGFLKSIQGPKSVQPGYRSDWDLGSVARFAFPLSISVFFAWGQLYGYRFIFANELGANRLGLFFSGYALGAAVVNTVENVLIQYFQPSFYKRVSQNEPVEAAAAWEEYSSRVIPSLLLCIGFVAGAAPFLAKLLLGSAFQSAARFAVWGAAVESLRASLAVFSLSAHAQTKTRPLILANIIAAVAALGLATVLIRPFGEIGVGSALVISYLLGIVMVYSYLGRGAHMPIRSRVLGDILLGTSFVLLFSIMVRFFLPSNLSIYSAVNGVGLLSVVFFLVLIRVVRIQPFKDWKIAWP